MLYAHIMHYDVVEHKVSSTKLRDQSLTCIICTNKTRAEKCLFMAHVYTRTLFTYRYTDKFKTCTL